MKSAATLLDLQTPLEYALFYARMGIAVFPGYEVMPDGSCACGNPQCQTIGKHPRVDRGFNAATTNEKTIRKWFTQWPDANVCIRTGETSDLLIIAVDPKNGGTETFDDLTTTHGPPPHTVESLTGGSGRHLFFTYAPVKSGTHALGPGVDIKANGGYVVAPPSLHASGRRYEFELSSVLGQVEIAELPAWVKEERDKQKGWDHPSGRASRSHTRQGYSPSGAPTEGMQQGEILHLAVVPPEGLWELRRGFEVDLACTYTLGLERYVKDFSPDKGSRPFSCLLHKPDTSPSAWLFMGAGGDILYHCEHCGGVTLTLPQVRASLAYGQVVRPYGLLHAVWRYRLLYEAGIMTPAKVDHRLLPGDVRESVRRVFEGFLLLIGLRWKDYPKQGATWTWRFAAAWCGLNQRTVAEAMEWLLKNGYIRSKGTAQRTAFGKPTPLFWPVTPREWRQSKGARGEGV